MAKVTISAIAADKIEPGAWNLPLYKIFCDPFNTARLIIHPKMHGGSPLRVAPGMTGSPRAITLSLEHASSRWA